MHTSPSSPHARTRWRPFLAAACAALAMASPTPGRADDVPKTVLVHYMPWYTSKPFSGAWGWHWTMNQYDPDRADTDGRPEIASHLDPLIGPYDSGDPDALECHVLLMKLAGIDGAIVDWYGTADVRDYGPIHRNTQSLVIYLKRAGLRFAACYEDQVACHEAGSVPDHALGRGRADLDWLSRNWFADDAYLRDGGRPLLLVFGPRCLEADAWTAILEPLSPRPLFLTLPHRARDVGADGAFGWPPVHGGREVAPETWRVYLHDLYARTGHVVAAAFPGFHDIYAEAGVHDSFGRIDARDGATFDETLDAAFASDAPWIQVATWNDYGEGTCVEPTTQHGYRYLEAIQRRAPRGAAFTPDDLRLPVRLYELRKSGDNTPEFRARLERASALLFRGNCARARIELSTRQAHGR